MGDNHFNIPRWFRKSRTQIINFLSLCFKKMGVLYPQSSIAGAPHTWFVEKEIILIHIKH